MTSGLHYMPKTLDKWSKT